jgi:hypothetical protein
MHGLWRERGHFFRGSFTDYATAIGTVGLAAMTSIAVRGEASERKNLRAERDTAVKRELEERIRADAFEREEAGRAAAVARQA